MLLKCLFLGHLFEEFDFIFHLHTKIVMLKNQKILNP